MNTDKIKCYFCSKYTSLVCVDCKKPICENHTYVIHHKAICPFCTRREQIKGRILKWIFLGISIILLIIALNFKI